jgi:hypothetical protein
MDPTFIAILPLVTSSMIHAAMSDAICPDKQTLTWTSCVDRTRGDGSFTIPDINWGLVSFISSLLVVLVLGFQMGMPFMMTSGFSILWCVVGIFGVLQKR